MKADRFVPRRIEDSFRNDQRNERQDREVGLQRFELLVSRIGAERGRLAEWKSKLERFGLERIRPSAGDLGRRKDLDDFVAACAQQLECFLRESCLANQCDAQADAPPRDKSSPSPSFTFATAPSSRAAVPQPVSLKLTFGDISGLHWHMGCTTLLRFLRLCGPNNCVRSALIM